MKFKAFVFALFFVGFTFSAQAQSTATPKVTKRQVKQQKRINQGVKSGELTKGETIQLKKQQKAVHKHKKHAKSDGKVTKGERARIHAHQNKASKNIARKKNNNRSRN